MLRYAMRCYAILGSAILCEAGFNQASLHGTTVALVHAYNRGGMYLSRLGLDRAG